MSLKILDLQYNHSNKIISYNNFNFLQGITIISGISGSGKTTLLHMIYKILPHQGHITWNDKNIDLISINHYYKYIISIVLQGGLTSYHFTLGDYFILLKKSKNNYQNYIDDLNLSSLVNQPIHTLSGGEKYRIAILIALIKNTPIILFDEPSAHLDQKMTENFITIINTIKNEKTILIASHDSNFLNNKKYQYYYIN